MAISIKRENFKGKYYIVVRDKGRFAARRRWNQKFNKRKAAGIWKVNKTLLKKVSKRTMTKKDRITGKPFIETVDTRTRQETKKPAKKYPFRITFKITINGKTIKGSSSARFWNRVSQAEDQAMENLLANLSYQLFGETDINEAEQMIKGKEHLIKREMIIVR